MEIITMALQNFLQRYEKVDENLNFIRINLKITFG